jgi:hypothetical protein
VTGHTEDFQRWLALEHEAVWLYGVIGARVNGLSRAARTSYDAHREVRDRLLQWIDDRGGRPVGTALSYGDDVVDSRRAARAAAADVESRIAAACLTAFGPADTAGRRFAMAGLRRAALAALDWGADVRAFPGLA